MGVIKVEKVTKWYSNAEKPAVKDISFTVNKGEILALLGPSGCGKTTTLRLIAGLECLDEGSILINDKVVSSEDMHIPVEKRDIGMVFQDYALFPHLTVEKNIRFGLKGYKDVVKMRTVELIDLVGLNGYERRYPHELSGGQQQRVALARALAPRPLVLLMDEPFSNLDAELRYEMREEVRKIVKETGITTVLVTHDQKDALSVSDRMIVMNKGLIAQCGTPRDIYQKPGNEFVASFLVKSNLVPGVCKQGIINIPLGKIPAPAGSKEGTGWLSVRRDHIKINKQGAFKARIAACNFEGVYMEIKLKVPDMDKYLICYHDSDSNLHTGQEVSFDIEDYCFLPDNPK